MFNKKDKNAIRVARHKKIRYNLAGDTSAPRLCVYRSLSHIYAQIIDDTTSNTLVSASTMDEETAKLCENKTKSEKAFIVGEQIAKRAISAKITKVVFDRAGYVYTGRVKNLAEGARNGGLQF